VLIGAVAAGFAAYLLVVLTLARHQLLADARAFASAQEDDSPPDTPETATAGNAQLTPAA